MKCRKPKKHVHEFRDWHIRRYIQWKLEEKFGIQIQTKWRRKSFANKYKFFFATHSVHIYEWRQI